MFEILVNILKFCIFLFRPQIFVQGTMSDFKKTIAKMQKDIETMKNQIQEISCNVKLILEAQGWNLRSQSEPIESKVSYKFDIEPLGQNKIA